MAVDRQSSALPAPRPVYILRGHAAQIHSVRFARRNTRLLTGDAHGWVVFWKVETKRALAVWKAHDGAILGTAEWGCDKIITHGRDNHLRIWQLRPSEETSLSTLLPAEPAQDDRPKPWLLHAVPVNTLNFCAFSMCSIHVRNDELRFGQGDLQDGLAATNSSNDPILIAVPATDDKKIEVYRFPDEKLNFVAPRPQLADTGMVMAVKLVHSLTCNNILLLVGYEGGFAAVYQLPRTGSRSALELAQLVYLSKAHSQPVLSLDASPSSSVFFTSSADAIIAAHRIPELPSSSEDVGNETSQSSLTEARSGQSLNAGEISGAKEDSHVPVPTSSPTSQTEDAKNHGAARETSPEPLSFSKQPLPANTPTPPTISFAKVPLAESPANTSKPAGLSTMLSSITHSEPRHKPPRPKPHLQVTLQPAYKTIDTKHAGQQSLHVRSDGRLLVTGGWDTRIRIYSSKTLKEVAVLKWHKEGVYAVAFSTILAPDEHLSQHHDADADAAEPNKLLVQQQETGLAKLQRQREEQMQLKHWVVAGAKDGKISLWEVF